MSFSDNIAEMSETRVTYGYQGREYSIPGPLQSISEQFMGFSLGGLTVGLTFLFSNGQFPDEPVLTMFYSASVIAVVILLLARPHVQKEVPWELKWVTRHLWVHSLAVLAAAALTYFW